MLRILVLWFLCINEAYQRKYVLPTFIKPCKINADLSKCAAQILEDLRPRLLKGISEFDLPPIDPLEVASFIIDRRNSRIASYIGNITNVRWTGMRDFKIVDIFLDLQELIFRLKLAFPQLLIDTKASIRGSVLTFEVDGDGGIVVNFTNVALDIVLNGEMYKYKGKEFIEWATEDVGITYDDVYYVDLYGFFEDPTVTHLWKLALNRGVRLLNTTFQTALRSISDFVTQAMNRVHKLFPKNVLYVP